ncbi:MAG: hypothetical protein ACR2JY_14915 [Chloroflexota bacterium]
MAFYSSAIPHTRLSISSWGTTADTNEARAAAACMDQLLQGDTQAGAPRIKVNYGGKPGVMVRDLASGPGPVTVIMLVRSGAAYKALAPGSVLAPDQQQALASLRFIPRVGPFPLAN